MKKLNVALLSGGLSPEREVSIKGGDQVYEALDKAKYAVVRYDPATDLAKLVANASHTDVAFIVLHGSYGEDGTVQGLLDLLNIPYQGSGVLGSALAMDKWTSKRLYKEAGLPVPSCDVLARGQTYDRESFAERPGYPLVVKPRHGGSSIGTSIVESPKRLDEALERAFARGPHVIVERYLNGIEITGSVLGNHHLEVFPIVEIIPESNHIFFDYEAKYKKGATREICPAHISQDLSELARSYAVVAHRALCCRGYSRTDMIIYDETIYVLETNTIPGMTPVSLFPLAAKAAGMSFSDLLDRLIELALDEAGDEIPFTSP
jgi:D-alanine-D-alanine ligase